MLKFIKKIFVINLSTKYFQCMLLMYLYTILCSTSHITHHTFYSYGEKAKANSLLGKRGTGNHNGDQGPIKVR